MTTFSFGPTVNPGRFRKQKALIKARASGVQAAHAQRRENEAAAQRKAQFERACMQAVIVGIKTALNFTVAECELPVWPNSPWYTPKTHPPAFYERAVRYFDPNVTEEFLHTQFHAFKGFWEIDLWIGARHTIVESMEFDGPWWKVPSRYDVKYPMWPEEYYYFDMSRVTIIEKSEEDDASNWRYWKLKPEEPTVPEPEPVWSDDRTVLDQAYQAMFNDPKLRLDMMDKNQGYVHGEMWWNLPGKLIRKLFQRRTK